MSAKLGLYRAIINTLAVIAIPVVLAVFGWKIQVSIEQSRVHSTYVTLATKILSNKEASPQLRQWATLVFERYSPIPIPESVKVKLRNPDFLLLPNEARSLLKTPLMAPPKRWLGRQNIATVGDLMKNYNANWGRFEENTATLRALQNIIRSMAGIENQVQVENHKNIAPKLSTSASPAGSTDSNIRER